MSSHHPHPEHQFPLASYPSNLVETSQGISYYLDPRLLEVAYDGNLYYGNASYAQHHSAFTTQSDAHASMPVSASSPLAITTSLYTGQLAAYPYISQTMQAAEASTSYLDSTSYPTPAASPEVQLTPYWTPSVLESGIPCHPTSILVNRTQSVTRRSRVNPYERPTRSEQGSSGRQNSPALSDTTISGVSPANDCVYSVSGPTDVAFDTMAYSLWTPPLYPEHYSYPGSSSAGHPILATSAPNMTHPIATSLRHCLPAPSEYDGETQVESSTDRAGQPVVQELDPISFSVSDFLSLTIDPPTNGNLPLEVAHALIAELSRRPIHELKLFEISPRVQSKVTQKPRGRQMDMCKWANLSGMVCWLMQSTGTRKKGFPMENLSEYIRHICRHYESEKNCRKGIRDEILTKYCHFVLNAQKTIDDSNRKKLMHRS